MFTVSYERFTLEQCGSKWEVISKTFNTRAEAESFIFRIKDNVQVNKIWIK